jgi:hypothetical protein
MNNFFIKKTRYYKFENFFSMMFYDIVIMRSEIIQIFDLQ